MPMNGQFFPSTTSTGHNAYSRESRICSISIKLYEYKWKGNKSTIIRTPATASSNASTRPFRKLPGQFVSTMLGLWGAHRKLLQQLDRLVRST